VIRDQSEMSDEGIQWNDWRGATLMLFEFFFIKGDKRDFHSEHLISESRVDRPILG